VNVAGKLINILFESTENVHRVADNASRVAIACTGQRTRHIGRRPAVRSSVKTKQYITNLGRKKKIVFGVSLVKIRTHDQLKVLRLIGEFKGLMRFLIGKFLKNLFKIKFRNFQKMEILKNSDL
jgi:hypothetical protein